MQVELGHSKAPLKCRVASSRLDLVLSIAGGSIAVRVGWVLKDTNLLLGLAVLAVGQDVSLVDDHSGEL